MEHARGPGSIPGQRNLFLLNETNLIAFTYVQYRNGTLILNICESFTRSLR